jgi:hypothetical protein
MKQRNWHPWLIKRYVQVLRNDIIEEDPLNMFSFFSWLRPSQGCESHLQRALANIVGELYIDSRNRSVGAFGAQNAVIENVRSICRRTYIFREDQTRGTSSGSHAPKGYTSTRCSRLSLTPASALHLCSADADPNKWHARACVEEYRARNSPRRCTWTTSRTRPGYRHGRFIRPFLSRARCFIRDGSRVVFSFGARLVGLLFRFDCCRW